MVTMPDKNEQNIDSKRGNTDAKIENDIQTDVMEYKNAFSPFTTFYMKAVFI